MINSTSSVNRDTDLVTFMFRSLSYKGQFEVYKYATENIHDKWSEAVKTNPQLQEPNTVESLEFTLMHSTADGSESMHRTVINYIRGCQYDELLDFKIYLCNVYSSELKFEKNVLIYENKCMDALYNRGRSDAK